MNPKPSGNRVPDSLPKDPRWQKQEYILANYQLHSKTLKRRRENGTIDSREISDNLYEYWIPDLEALVMTEKIKKRSTTSATTIASASPIVSSYSDRRPAYKSMILSTILIISWLFMPVSESLAGKIMQCAVLVWIIAMFCWFFYHYKQDENKQSVQTVPPGALPQKTELPAGKKKSWPVFLLTVITIMDIVLFYFNKETALMIALFFSIGLIYYTGAEIERLPVNVKEKIGLWVLLIIIPLAGFAVVYTVGELKSKGVF
jgi:hypothetical protein